MEQNVELKAGGIKCDNPKCNWADNDVPVETYAQWLNRPCPECGENLLTEEDYKNSEALLAAWRMVNSLTPEQLESFSSTSLEETLKTPMFKDAKGVENIKDGVVVMSFETHKEVKCVEAKNIEP